MMLVLFQALDGHPLKLAGLGSGVQTPQVDGLWLQSALVGSGRWAVDAVGIGSWAGFGCADSTGRWAVDAVSIVSWAGFGCANSTGRWAVDAVGIGSWAGFGCADSTGRWAVPLVAGLGSGVLTPQVDGLWMQSVLVAGLGSGVRSRWTVVAVGIGSWAGFG